MREFVATTSKNNAAREYQHIDVRPYAGALGAEILGIDLRKVDDASFAEIKQASLDHLVIFFRDQELSVGDYEEFTQRFGAFGDDPYLEHEPGQQVVRLVKEADEATPFVFGAAWHSDWSFLERPPAYTLLYGTDIPPYGGDTLYANLYLVYEWLSDEMKRICESLVGIHSAERGYGPDAKHNALVEHMNIRTGVDALKTQEHPLVRTHPETGRKAIFANPVYTVGLKGLKPQESEPILSTLYALADHPVFTCRFRWEPRSLAIWDNRCTWHLPLADYHGLRREALRTTVAGTVPR